MPKLGGDPSSGISSGDVLIEAERLGGLEIDREFVLHRCLHRKVGCLLALENAIDIAGRDAARRWSHGDYRIQKIR